MPTPDGAAILLRLDGVQQAAAHVRALYNVAARRPDTNGFHIVGVHLAATAAVPPSNAASNGSGEPQSSAMSNRSVPTNGSPVRGRRRRRLFNEVSSKPSATSSSTPKRDEWPPLPAPSSPCGPLGRPHRPSPAPVPSTSSVTPSARQRRDEQLITDVGSPVSSTASPAPKKTKQEDKTEPEPAASSQRRPNARDKKRLQKQKDRERKARARADSEVRKREAAADAERRRKARQDSDVHLREAASTAERMREARENEDFRIREAASDVARKRASREDEDFRRREAASAAERMREAREDEDFRRREAASAADRMRAARQEEEFRLAERAAENLRRQQERQYAERRERYFNIIKEGPTWKCCCCGQLWFRRSVKAFSEAQLAAKRIYGKWRAVCSCRDLTDDVFVLCGTCQRYLLQKMQVPPLALANGLEFPPIPEPLQGIDPLEERFFSPRIPFMMIRPLTGSGDQQFGLRGNCVNVPIDVNTTVSALPRLPRDTQVVYVQLMRRMRDQRPYAFAGVRPSVVLRAARYLVNTPLYRKHNIALDENWLESFAEDMAREQQRVAELEMSDVDDPDGEQADAWGEETEEERQIMELQETLLDDIILPDTGVRIAPGEGRVPLSLLFDEDVEELSFPTIYAGQLRQSRVSLSQRIKAEARMHDRRCANPTKMFFSFCRLRRERLSKQIYTAVRKKRRSGALSVRDVVGQAAVDQLVQHNEGYRVLQVDRSSPAYLEAKKKVLMAMVRQYNVPTIFATMSCAEYRWAELLVILKQTLDGITITEEEARDLLWEEKVRLVQSDPYTVSRYCNHKFSELWKLIMTKGGPLKEYPLVQYFTRVEFQSRGSVHFHCLLWLEGAPKFDANDPESWALCEAFIDHLITCFNDPEQADLMSVQIHRHTRSCRREIRGEAVCRYGFPLPPMRATKILFPLAEDTGREERKRLKVLHKENQVKILDLHKQTPALSFDEVLEKLGCSESDYLLAVRSQLQRPKVYLRRALNAILLNGHSIELAQLLNANSDMQFVLDAYSCIVYIVDYVSKSERSISLLIREAADRVRAGNLSLVEQLREISNVFINKSETSAQEVAFHNLSMPLTMCSVSNIYINTSPPEERTRMLKTPQNLEWLMEQDPDSEDVFVHGLLEHYVERPDVMEDVCLADFAAWYEFSSRRPRQQQEREDVDDDLEEPDEEEVPANKLPLKDGSGYVRRRTKAKLIRFRSYSAAEDLENFMREQVMLYLAWRSEEAFSSNALHIYSDEASHAVIKANRAKYVKNSVDLDALLEEVIRNQVQEPEDGDDEQVEFRRPNVDVFELDQVDIGQDLGPDVFLPPVESERFLLPNFQPEEEYLADIAGLNERQRHFHDNYVHHIKTKPGEQMLCYISGGAGVGKTRLIKVTTQSTIRVHVQQGGHPDHLVVALMAPTARAAFTMGGVTLHSGLRIFQQNEENQLGADTLNTLRAELCHIRLFTFDEVSMIGNDMLSRIDGRMKQIFNNRLVMGGKSVLVFGDLNQLSPVGDSWCFLPLPGALNQLAGPLIWRSFKHFELTEIMRQREDVAFAEALRRLARGCTTPEDDAMFASRVVGTDGLQVPETAVHMFGTNDAANALNGSYLNSLNTESCESDAMDYCEGLGTERARSRALHFVREAPLNKTQNLPKHFLGKVGALYTITANISTRDGIVNGTPGFLRRIVWGRMADNERTPLRVYLECGEEVGRRARTENAAVMRRDGVTEPWTPIGRVTRGIIPSKGATFKVMRKQFPLVASKAITVHRSQGSTFLEAAVHSPLSGRAMYVAYSRATSLAGLYLVGAYKRRLAPRANDPVMLEQQRLNLPENTLQFSIQFPDLHAAQGTSVALFHNIRSLHKHHRHVLQDANYTACNFLMLCETWTLPEDDISIPGFAVLHRRDCLRRQRHAFGTALYVRDALSASVEVVFGEEAYTQFHGPALHAFADIVGFIVSSAGCRSGVVFLHKSPKCRFQAFSASLKRCLDLLSSREVSSITVVGDFNMDVKKREGNPLKRLMDSYSLNLKVAEEAVSTDSLTLIDVCFSNLPNLTAHITESMISDHKPVWFPVST